MNIDAVSWLSATSSSTMVSSPSLRWVSVENWLAFALSSAKVVASLWALRSIRSPDARLKSVIRSKAEVGLRRELAGVAGHEHEGVRAVAAGGLRRESRRPRRHRARRSCRLNRTVEQFAEHRAGAGGETAAAAWKCGLPLLRWPAPEDVQRKGTVRPLPSTVLSSGHEFPGPEAPGKPFPPEPPPPPVAVAGGLFELLLLLLSANATPNGARTSAATSAAIPTSLIIVATPMIERPSPPNPYWRRGSAANGASTPPLTVATCSSPGNGSLSGRDWRIGPPWPEPVEQVRHRRDMHRPPRRVSMPRALSSAAIARRVVAPPARMSATTGARSRACRSALADTAALSGGIVAAARSSGRSTHR